MKIQVPTPESIQANKRKRLLNLVENACKHFQFNLENVIDEKCSTILDAPSTVVIENMGYDQELSLIKEILDELYLKEDEFVIEFNNAWQGKCEITKTKNRWERSMFQVTNIEKEVK